MRRGTVLGALLLVSYAWFYQAGGWNQNSRFDLVRSICEQGTLRIDAYHQNTGDKARFGGHVYSDKAPGLALAAVPAVAVARVMTTDIATLSWLATVWAAALPTVLAALFLLGVARRLRVTEGGATFAALAFGLGSPAWAYATLFWGHAMVTGCLAGAFAAACALATIGPPRRDVLLGLAVGGTAGWAVVTEFPAAAPAAILASFALVRAGRARAFRVGLGLVAGAGATAAVLAAYNAAAFGSPIHIGYAHVDGWGGMRAGVMGVTYPKPRVLVEILFGPYRGLFPHAPILALGAPGLVLLARRPGARGPGLVAAAIVAYYVLFNASYAYWDGGWSHGPRHLSPALPFLALGLAPLWDVLRRGGRAALAVVAAASVALTLVAVATTAQPPEAFRRPLTELQWPAFRDGDLGLNHQSFLEGGADPRRLRGGSLPHDAWNLGEKMGLRGLASLSPLALLWAAGAGALVSASRRGRASRGEAPRSPRHERRRMPGQFPGA